MSDKIKKQLEDKSKKIVLSDAQFAYITSLDNIEKSFSYYLQQLKTAYLQTLTLDHGFTAEDNLELSIDLKSESHELTVTQVQ